MASKQTSSPASPPQPPNGPSKLPKFLQRNGRDRSRSVTETPPIASSSSSGEMAAATPSKGRRASRFLPRRDREDEAAVVVEPIAIPRQAVEPSSSRSIGDIPSRLSGWFSHTFNSSTTDLNLNTIMAQPSPKSKASALLAVAKHGKAHVDKAMRYLLDSDATPDRCTDPIWLLGVQHPGYEPSSPTPPPYATARGKRVTSPPSSYRSSTSSIASSSTDLSNVSPSASQQQQQQQKINPAAHWPPVFYIDFVSRIWLTYRSQFPQPIKDATLTDLCASCPPSGGYDPVPTSTTSLPASSPSKSRWHWGGEKTWSSDTGWGCMLRTGQSLLANALLHAHLGRDWRKPPYPVYTSDYATYVQILTWFFDTPSPEAPFSVHRMALAGKELGTDVGQWFGPSVAAGAIKRLVNQFPRSCLGVSVAKDGVLSQTDVFLASYSDPSTTARPHSKSSSSTSNLHQALHWGDRPVLILVGLRLGIDGVNPIYYETIKTLFTFPSSVGIAGGRPSSSYYFVGSQADNLFYLDPHHARPAIPLRSVANGMTMGSVLDISSQSSQSQQQQPQEKEMLSVPTETLKRDRSWSSASRRKARHQKPTTGASPPSSYHPPPQQELVSPTSPTSAGSLSGTTSPRHGPTSPSRHRHLSSDEGDSLSELGEQQHHQHHQRGPIPISVVLSTSSTSTTNTLPSVQSNSASVSGGGGKGGLDPLQEHYVTSYSNAELRTFHCDKVRKMPLSGLDPSMLLGFLCRDAREWEELRKGIEELPRSIFSIQNEHPNWQQEDYDDESMMGLESMSDPEEEVEVDDDDDDDEDEEEGEGKEEEDEGDDDDDLELDMDLGEESQVRKKKGKKVKAIRKDRRDAKVEPRTTYEENPHDNDEVEDDEEEEGEDEEDDEYYEPPSLISHSTSASTSTTTTTNTTTSTNTTTTEEEELETEEDPVEALTPGPNNTRFELREGKRRGDGGIIPAGSADSSESGHHHHHHHHRPHNHDHHRHRHHHHRVVVGDDGGKGKERDREGGGRKKGKQPVGRDDDDYNEEGEEESDIEDGWFGIGDDEVEEEEEEEDDRQSRRERHESVGTPLAGSEMTIGAGEKAVIKPRGEDERRSPVLSPPPTTTNSESKDKSSSATSTTSKSKSKSVASSSPSSPPSKSKSSHTKAKSDPDHAQKRKKEKKKAVPVPVVSIPVSRSRSATTPTTSNSNTGAAVTFPFPGSGSDDGDFEDGMVEVVDGGGFVSPQQQQQQQQVWREGGSGRGPGTRSWERGRYESQSWAGVGTNVSGGSTGGVAGAGAGATGEMRMFKGKGRDGGRTQSGGVKGILTDRS